MEKYGKTIAKLRREQGMTQSELGRALNVTYQAVSKWEHDLSQPDFETIVALCKLFGISVDDFTILASGGEIGESAPAAPAPVSARADNTYNNNYDADDEELNDSVRRSGSSARRPYNPASQPEKTGFRVGYFIGLIVALVLAVAVFIGGTIGEPSIWYGWLILAYMVFSYVALIGHESIVWEIMIGGLTKIVDMPGVIFSLDVDGILFLIVYKCIIAPLATLAVWLLFAIGGFLLSFIMAPFVFPFKIPRILKDTF